MRQCGGDAFLAQPDLIVDRCRRLVLRKVPGINDGAHGHLQSDRRRFGRRPQAGEQRLVAARGFETPGLIIVPLGGFEIGVAEHVVGIADVHRVFDGDGGRGSVAEPVRRQRGTKGVPCLVRDAMCFGVEKGPPWRGDRRPKGTPLLKGFTMAPGMKGAWIGMLVVETVAKIRRAYSVPGKAIKAICRELHVSRKVVRKVLRSEATEFHYEREEQPLPRLGRWLEDLEKLLSANEAKPSRERLTLIRVFEQLRGRGYEGGYDAVRRYARGWQRDRASTSVGAYVPLSFAPGEAYQFDWSHEIVLINGTTVTVKPANVQPPSD